MDVFTRLQSGFPLVTVRTGHRAVNILDRAERRRFKQIYVADLFYSGLLLRCFDGDDVRARA